MHFAFNDEQKALQHGLRDLLEHRCTPARLRVAWSRPSGRIPELWPALAELGLVGATAPEDAGGLELDCLDWVLMLEETGRFAVPEPVVEHIAVSVPLLRELGPSPKTRELLSGAAAGTSIVTAQLADMPYVSHGDAADAFLFQKGDEVHLLDAAEVSLRSQSSVDGARRLFSAEWTPSPTTLLARGPVGRKAASDARDRGVLATSAQLVGLGRAMLDEAVKYAGIRKQFGKPIGSFQAVKHLLADALVALEFARPLVYRAAHSLTHDDPDRSLHVSLAKAHASEAAHQATRASLQVHGAIGYSFEADLHLLMKRAWALSSSWGDATWHRNRIATHLLGETA